MRKTTQLKNLLRSQQLEYLMEAHSGLSARIVNEAGFSGIWASGLSISASLGLRDNNEASWTQVLDVVEYMSDATSIPILLDADTGYGNFNNVRRLVRKLEQREVAGMCIEDKIFPKSNSFREGKPQPMAPMDEFVGKIKAAKDTQRDPDFCVVARVEALIAGYGLEEALRRARAYADAGADAVLIHSKLATAFQILAFMEHWKQECPVVIVPTKYYTTPVEVFQSAGISVVIWANHLMRSSITAMQRVAAQIHQERSLVNVEPSVATLNEVFRLQGEDELVAAEAKYLPAAIDDDATSDQSVRAPDISLMPRSGTDGRPVSIG
jgi:phosphoenolpyruvate phosphomutase